VPADLRRHAPFAALVAALAVFTAWLQLNIGPFASPLLSLHIFFQVMLGASAIAVFRNVVGLKTYGTFGAVIVATAMLVEGPFLGFLIFGSMLAAVVVSRAALSREGIQESHRVAILVTVVAVAAVLASVAGFFTHLANLAYAALFPILITAWIAERFVEEVSRIGWPSAFRTLAWTFAAVVLAYAVMVQSAVVAIVILNPILWTVLVLANWFLGTRVRFRLSERYRFRGAKPGADDTDLGGSILTMNRRNREYVDRYNPPALLASLDKNRVKEILVPEGIPMPRTYLVVRGRQDLDRAAELVARLPAFAIKPASSYGGEGILLVHGREGERYRVNGHSLSKDGLLRHVQRIVDGDFNDGVGDVALLEELLLQDPVMAPLVFGGVADVRVLCLLGHPVMAMARLPTRASKGRANLHSGAVGTGIDLRTGRITTAVWRGTRVELHPDTGVLLKGFQIPCWREILEIAAAAQAMSGLGFAGVDIVLDARHGPVVLEVNRRPGLEIQNANREGLLSRLRAVESIARIPGPPERRVQAVLDLDAVGWRGRPGSVPPAAPATPTPAPPARGF